MQLLDSVATNSDQTQAAFGIYTNLFDPSYGFVSQADPKGRTLKLYLVSGRVWGPMTIARSLSPLTTVMRRPPSMQSFSLATRVSAMR